jgi:type IV secretory pathway component VirB8
VIQFTNCSDKMSLTSNLGATELNYSCISLSSGRRPANSPAVKNLKKLNNWAFLIAVGALVLMFVLICAVVFLAPSEVTSANSTAQE